MLRRKTMTLATISAIVTTGVRRVPMLSFSGNTAGGGDYRRLRPPPRVASAAASGRRSGRRGQLPGARALLRHVLVGVIARPHEPPGRDVVEPERVRGALERRELVG